MADDTVSIRIRARGGRQAGREADMAANGIGRIGRAARGSIGGVRTLGSVTASTNRGLRVTSGLALSGGAAIAGLGVIAAKSGLQFNASMEQNEIAFTQFLGTTQRARTEFGFLQQTAARTPFELPQITQAARKLLAFNFPLKQTNSLLSTVGDAAAGAGLGADAIDRIVLSLGQIRSKGRLQSEELLQLQELGVLDTTKLRRNLGLTAKQMGDVGNQGVSGDRAIRAIQKTLDDTFGGQAAKQARSFNGQMSTLHDNLNMTLGTITRPGFKLLETRVLPALGKTTQQINDTFSRKDLSLAEKMSISEADAKRNFGPLVTAARSELGRMHLGDKMANEFEKAVPVLADAAGHAAPRVAGALVSGFMSAGPYGKMFAAGLLLKRLGVFSLMGRASAGAFLRTYVPTVVAGETAANAGGAGGAAGKAGRLGRLLPWLGPLGLAAGAGAVGGKLVGDALHDTAIGRGARGLIGNDPASVRRRSRSQMRKKGLEPVDVGGVTVWEKPGDARRERARARSPRARGATVHHTTIVKVRERELGRANDRYVADETARNRRPR